VLGFHPSMQPRRGPDAAAVAHHGALAREALAPWCPSAARPARRPTGGGDPLAAGVCLWPSLSLLCCCFSRGAGRAGVLEPGLPKEASRGAARARGLGREGWRRHSQLARRSAARREENGKAASGATGGGLKDGGAVAISHGAALRGGRRRERRRVARPEEAETQYHTRGDWGELCEAIG
jgi:hypothetical protein